MGKEVKKQGEDRKKWKEDEKKSLVRPTYPPWLPLTPLVSRLATPSTPHSLHSSPLGLKYTAHPLSQTLALSWA